MGLPWDGFMSANHIAQDAFEPQRANNVLVEFRVGPLLGGQASSNVLMLSLESFPIPRQQNDPLEQGYLNDRRKFAGMAMADDMDVTFRSYVDQPTLELLSAWRQRVYDPATGRIGRSFEYKRNANVWFLPPNAVPAISRYGVLPNDIFVLRLPIYGVWPSAIDYGQADMNSGDHLRTNVTFSVDVVGNIETTVLAAAALPV